MPKSLWKLADADVIAARLTRLLPTRPARGQRGPVTFAVGWQPSAKAAVAVACVALALGYAISAMVQGIPTRFDGSDVASFTVPAVALDKGGSVPRSTN